MNKRMNELGLAIKQLLRKHQILSRDLAKAIGITPGNLSQIVNGHAKPRQTTFTRLCQALAKSPDDEKRLVDAFVRIKDGTPETMTISTQDYEQAETERAERFLEVKAQSVAFKRAVAAELDRAGITYQQDYCEGIYITDFLVERGGKRLAIECKFNIQRDFEKTVRIAQILQDALNCDQTLVVVPYLDKILKIKLPEGVALLSLTELAAQV